MDRFLSLEFSTMITMAAALGCAIGLVWGLLTMEEEIPDNVVPLHA